MTKRSMMLTIVPSMIAGGLLFGSVRGDAATGDGPAFDPWGAVDTRDAAGKSGPVVAQAGSGSAKPAKPAKPATPPAPPPPPGTSSKAVPPPPGAGPKPPLPPPPVLPGLGAGIQKIIDHKMEAAIDAVKDNPSIPKDVRDTLTKRLSSIKTKVGKRVGGLDLSDMDKFEDEMEKLGEEIEKEMEAFEKEMEKLGPAIEKDVAAKLKKLGVDSDFDFDFDFDHDHHGIPMAPGVTIDPDDDLAEALDDLKDLALKPAQRDAISKLRVDSDRTVATAKKQLDDLSGKLETALASSATTDADIGKLVDQISAQEAAIRKSRLVAWAQARRVLDDAQRKKIEDAAKKTK